MNHSSSIGLDVDYTPTLAEWMRIESQTPWGFWRDGVYLEVSFMREHTLVDPTKPGAYVVTDTKVKRFTGTSHTKPLPMRSAVSITTLRSET